MNLVVESCERTRQLCLRHGAFHREKNEVSENDVSAVLCLQQSRTCNMLFVLRKDLGFMKLDGNHERSLQRDWASL